MTIGIADRDRRLQMLRLIGWLVVTGFALYGGAKFVEDHVVLTKDDTDPMPE